jgi:hypothetical protein
VKKGVFNSHGGKTAQGGVEKEVLFLKSLRFIHGVPVQDTDV